MTDLAEIQQAEHDRRDELAQRIARFSPGPDRCQWCGVFLDTPGSGWFRVYDDEYERCQDVAVRLPPRPGWYAPCEYCNPKAILP